MVEGLEGEGEMVEGEAGGRALEDARVVGDAGGECGWWEGKMVGDAGEMVEGMRKGGRRAKERADEDAVGGGRWDEGR